MSTKLQQLPEWLPDPADRPEGFECLIFFRGKWTNVRWCNANYEGWSLGYLQGFVKDTPETLYAPLP